MLMLAYVNISSKLSWVCQPADLSSTFNWMQMLALH